jgi:hypothetical protein
MSLSKFTVPTDSVVSGSINATNGLFVSASSTGIRNNIGGDGSNKFGYLSSNTHIFTGSVNITGSLSASTAISASAFFGDGSNLKNAGGNSATFLDGTGKTNYIPKWKDENTLNSSVIYQNGTNIGIGNINPVSKLDVSGDLRVTTDIVASGSLTVGKISNYPTPGTNIPAYNMEDTVSINVNNALIDATDGVTISSLSSAYSKVGNNFGNYLRYVNNKNYTRFSDNTMYRYAMISGSDGNGNNRGAEMASAIKITEVITTGLSFREYSIYKG